jgi:hypothetical protein
LLSCDDALLAELGFKSVMHLNRMKASIRQLVVYQETFDIEVEEEKSLKKAEKWYFEAETKFNALMASNPDYELPALVQLWTTEDLFFFIKTATKNKELFSIFLKPLAMSRINGNELLTIFDQMEEKKEDEVRKKI